VTVQAVEQQQAAERDLQGKVAIVTGGARGIGRAIALVLARRGADVVVADLDPAEAEEVAEQAAQQGVRAVGARLDVTSWEENQALVARVLGELGRIDVLVNNAGVSRSVPFVDLDEGEWDRVLDVNAKGVFLACRAVVPHMVQRRAGRIVSISSMVGKEAIPLFVHYCASKFAVIGLTQGLAKELAEHDITVNAVCPGVLRTPLWEPLLDQLSATKGISRDAAFAEFVAGIPLGRPQEPEDIGEAVAFLASDRARNITGEAMNVSGGQQML